MKPIDRFINESKYKIENEMQTIFENKDIPKVLQESMEYSLFAGGKRLRPVLLCASFETFRSDVQKIMKTAIALEMIHTYSLIHDDLPAMDDDDYRRGALTNHKQFDEATAILAGDALLTLSFQLISEDALLSDEEKVYLIQQLSSASGPTGMVAGQVLDMEGENKQLSIQQLENIHEQKTGRLISFAIISGAYLAGISKEKRHHLERFAYYLGLIFQVQDDILDIVGDPEKLGKPVGSDTENEKSTYPSLLGLDGAKKHKDNYVEKATAALQLAEAEDSYLVALLHYFSQRDH